MIHIALVSAYPTEAEARKAVSVGLVMGGLAGPVPAYRGIWIHPTPEQPLVHVFAEDGDEVLASRGWTRP